MMELGSGSLGIGVGLRSQHYSYVFGNRPRVDWFEALSENYLGLRTGGPESAQGQPLRVLEAIRREYPVVLHGVSLSIGSTDPLDREYLASLKKLAEQVEPAWMSDHLCWTGVGGENLHDLLPLPYTEEAIRHVASRISEVQDFLGRRMLFENVSSYLTYAHSEMTEWEFIAEVAQRADCGILLDINNIHVSSVNLGFDPREFLRGVPRDRVGQFHLAGYSDLGTHLIDTHDHAVSEPVWALYEEALRIFGAVSTLVEWDDRIPPFPELEGEARRARAIQEKVENESYGNGKKSARTLPRSATKLASLDHHGSPRSP